jgi:hypothetical protein
MKNALNTIVMIFIVSALVIFGAGFYVGARYTDNQIGINKLQTQVDSLRDENFILGVELSRWETTIEWYKENHPKEAQKLEEWRSHNTE